MAIALTELMKNSESLEDFLKKAEESGPRCGKCLTPFSLAQLQEGDIFQTEQFGRICGDCYFAELGEEVEQNPIHTPGIRRG